MITRNGPKNEPVLGLQAAGLVLAAILPTLLAWLYFVALRDQATALEQSVYTAGKLLQFSLPLGWLLLFRKTTASLHNTSAPVALGATGSASAVGEKTLAEPVAPACKARIGASLRAGLWTGLIMAGVMLLGYWLGMRKLPLLSSAGAAIHAKLADFGVDSPAKFALLAAFYAIAHSLLEEYYWRWFLFGQLRRRWSFRSAAAVSSLAFASHHVIVVATYFGWSSWATWCFSAAVALAGVVWSWLYNRTGSLAGPWLSHVFTDAALFLIGYDLVRTMLA